MSHRTTNFDQLLASVPTNATAARVTTGNSQEEEESKRDSVRRASRIPPRLATSVGYGLPDLRGRVVGRLTVLGLADTKNDQSRGKNARPAWAVRCSCGDYEERSTKSLLNPNNDFDACVECKRMIELRWAEHKRRTGHNKPKRDFV